MKYVHEYRQADAVKGLAAQIAAAATRPWTLMEVCGGQTHAIVKFGLQQFLPEHIELLHGPGCPVCVTPVAIIDQAIELASRPQVIFCTFGDMLRVPGSRRDLLAVRAAGADVRVVYSPTDAVDLARRNPDQQVVFFAIGFETTAPANAMAAFQAQRQGLDNFSLLVSQFQVPPVLSALCDSAQCRVQGFLAAGHVCTVMGYHQYPSLAQRYQVPIVITGFEPVDILQGILECIVLLERGQASVSNRYRRAVSWRGNVTAQQMIDRVFTTTDQHWRGFGTIERSGFALQDRYRAYDATLKFNLQRPVSGDGLDEGNGCISGAILQGLKKPGDCPYFGNRCQPTSPMGAPMVSSEGACAAYYRFSRNRPDPHVRLANP